MEHFRLFVLPFYAGTIFLAVALVYKFARWVVQMEPAQRKAALRALPTRVLWDTVVECVRESLLHLRIWKRNPFLGYMHTTFALGWFLLIVVGWIETMVYFKGENVPLYVDIFFSYYVHPIFERNFNFSLIKDALLLILLVGVGIAMFKRVRSRALGMRRTTKHIWGDRVALWALWMIFPARLLAESMTSAEIREFGGTVWSMSADAQIIPPGVGCGSFLTNNFGQFLADIIPGNVLQMAELPAWWLYSLALGLFFAALPFSRYMHIFAEIPLIFLRNAGLRSSAVKCGGYDKFQVSACSRCGICVDPCQLQSQGDIQGVQSVYFLRDRRYARLGDAVANNCLMCGRCEAVCPVGIELNTLRTNSRHRLMAGVSSGSYSYLQGVDRSQGAGRVGYFMGCMGHLVPKVGVAMAKIFDAAGQDVWWADRDGGACCGRPLKLSGQSEAAQRMMDYNSELFAKHGITTLVTSCPICLKVFREDYKLDGVEVLHHSEYIERLLGDGIISVQRDARVLTYHDPCELGRGSGVYAAPRSVISAVGTFVEGVDVDLGGLCCGSSLANSAITDGQQVQLAAQTVEHYRATRAEVLVTACPLCKKALSRPETMVVEDLAEVVAAAL